MKRFSFLLPLLMVTSTPCSAIQTDTLVRIPHSTLRTFHKRGIQFSPDHFHHKTAHVGYVASDQLRSLSKSIRGQIQILDEKQWAAGGYNPITFELHPKDLTTHYEGYHDHEALTLELAQLKLAHSSIMKLESAGKSGQGRDLWYVKISDNAGLDEHEPKLFFHANMHGDEVVGRELMIYLIRELVSNYGRDPRITKLVNHAQIFIMPSHNPDGFHLRRRSNANGYDLNRDFPDQFTSPADSTQGRQIETAHMIRLADKHHFLYGINWHGGAVCINLPWDNMRNTAENKFGDDGFFKPIARQYARLNPPMYQNHGGNFDHGLTYGYEWYPINGGINDWFAHFRRSVQAIVELSNTKWPAAQYLPDYWEENKEAMLSYLEHGLRGIHVRVTDTSGNPIPNATIEVDYSPKRPMRFDTAYIHRLGPLGTHSVTLRAQGYQSASMEMQATEFTGTYETVELISNKTENEIKLGVNAHHGS